MERISRSGAGQGDPYRTGISIALPIQSVDLFARLIPAYRGSIDMALRCSAKADLRVAGGKEEWLSMNLKGSSIKGEWARKPRPYAMVAIRRKFLSSSLFTRLISYRSVV